MRTVRSRALVLCAGFGTRLRPLTWAMPKPLLPIDGEPVVGTTLRQLEAAGCEAAVLNLHYRAEDLPRALGRSYRGLALEYSYEPEILGTCGALFPPRALLRECDAVVLVNGDSYCRRWPIRQVLEHHRRRGADATLLLLPSAPESALGGGIAVDREGRVVQMRELEKAPGEIARRHGFAGLHVLSPHLLDRVEPRFGDIIEDLYQPLLVEGGRIESRVLSRRRTWHDLGTPGRYHQASIEALDAEGLLAFRAGRRSSISPLARIGGGAIIDRSLIARGARIGDGALIRDSIVLEGAEICDGCQIKSSIVGPGTELASASEVEQRMITSASKHHELAANESQMGDLVYTPL